MTFHLYEGCYFKYVVNSSDVKMLVIHLGFYIL